MKTNLEKITINQSGNEKMKVFQYDPAFYKMLLALAVPIMLQNMLGSMLNLVDNVMVGGLGKEALAAVGIANQIFYIFAIILFGINAGLSVFIAQFWGKKALAEIRQAVGMGLIFCLLFGVAFMIMAIWIPERLISIFTSDRAVIALGVDFLKIVALSYPLTAVSMVYSVSLRSTEKPVFPLISSVVSLVLNTILNYLLVYGKFGFPKLGVKGSAIATIAARILEFILIFGMVYRMDLVVSCKWRDIQRINRRFVASIIKVAIPIIMNESLWVLGTSIFSVVYGRMGTDQYASYNMIQTLDKIAFVAILGLGNACAVLVGKQIGEGNKERAYIYGARSNFVAPIIGILIGMIIILIRNPVVSLYDVPVVVKEGAGTLMMIMGIFMFVRSMNFTNLMGVLRAGGDVRLVLALETIPLWVIAVPLTIFTGLYLHWPITVVYLLSLCEEVIKCIFGMVRFFTKKWIHDLVQTKETEIAEELVIAEYNVN